VKSTGSTSRRTPPWSGAPAGDGRGALRRGLREHPPGPPRTLRKHHGVRIRDSALIAAATLSKRYLPDRTSRTRPSTWWTRRQPPPDGDRQRSRGPGPVGATHRQLEIERQGLVGRRGRRPRSDARRGAGDGRPEGEGESLRAQWKTEKEAVIRIREGEGEQETARHELEMAERRGDGSRRADQVRQDSRTGTGPPDGASA
jgi:ATP-dependent Clp protease ATP-binding subunit ClpB